MKAKELAEKYIQAKDKDECVVDIIMDFHNELVHLIHSRNAQNNETMFSIFNELDLKWMSLSKRLDGVLRKDGFQLYIKDIYPGVFEVWMKYKARVAGKLRMSKYESRTVALNHLIKFRKRIEEIIHGENKKGEKLC